jgi:two-component system, sporulation sensor kinase B
VELTMHFLFNLSLLIVLLFFCILWVEKSNSLRLYQFAAVLFFVGALILCNVFSYRLTDELVLDMRIVPFLVGGLYLGLSPLLGLLLLIGRGVHGIDIGFYAALLFYGVFSFLVWRISPWFLKLTSKKRISFAVGVTLLVSLIILIGLETVSSPVQALDVWFAYLFIPPLGVAMISYCIEVIDKNLLLREHIVKSKKLEAVEQMGAAISHEIRNPLTSALGFVQLLKDDSLQKETREEFLNILKEELESAERVIQDYLTFSKPKIDSTEKLNVQEELKNVLKLLHPIANKNSVEYALDLPTDCFIEGNRQKFLQCFINVMKNAIESMPQGGILIVGTETTSKKVTIRIQDTGIGMTKVQVGRLGEPYYTTKGGKGTGLGMMVVYSIVRAMNGTVHVESEVGMGTCFEFSFKRCSQDIVPMDDDLASKELVGSV